MNGVLVVVPCGQKKIWDRTPSAGATAAKDVHIGPPFGINKTCAEKFGEAWVILSAKYGFIEPDFEIAGPYKITFKKKRSGPIATARLREQLKSNTLTATPPASVWAARSIERQLSLLSPVGHRNCASPPRKTRTDLSALSNSTAKHNPDETSLSDSSAGSRRVDASSRDSRRPRSTSVVCSSSHSFDATSA